jgi:hypothetical protein
MCLYGIDLYHPGEYHFSGGTAYLRRKARGEFKISGRPYSPGSQTLVTRINEKVLQEEQGLVPGLKPEEIVPDGVIFSFRGYRFRVDLNGSR